MLIARAEEDLHAFARDSRWRVPTAAARAWTDDYANIASALRWTWPW